MWPRPSERHRDPVRPRVELTRRGQHDDGSLLDVRRRSGSRPGQRVELEKRLRFGLPVPALPGGPQAPVAHLLAGGGWHREDRRDGPRDVGRVVRPAEHAERAMRLVADDPPHLGEVARDHGDPGGEAFEQLVRRRQPVVEGRGLDRHDADVGRMRPTEAARRGDRRQHVEAAPRSAARAPGPGTWPFPTRSRARPRARAHSPGSQDRLGELLDAAVGGSAHRGRGRSAGRADPGRVPDQVGSRIRGSPARRGVAHDERPPRPKPPTELGCKRLVHRHERLGVARPAALPIPPGSSPGPARAVAVEPDSRKISWLS